MSERTGSNTRPVYLVDGCRTPFLKARGVPGPFSAADLAVGAGRPLLLRQPFPAEAIDEVILGCVVPSPEEMNVARIAALRLGCSERTPAWTVQRNCASGLQALDSAAQSIASGRADLVLAGGTEAMSHAPVLFGRAFVDWLGRWSRARGPTARGRLLTQLRPQDLVPVIGLLKGLTDPIVGLSMGQTAEHLAWRFGIDREAMDRFALRSHQRLGTALSDHVFSDEITPLIAPDGTAYARDEGYRADSDLEQLGALRPVFDRPTGAVTAGNSAQVTDGAALLLLASEEAMERWDMTVLAQLVDIQWAALDPTEMGLGPVHAMAPLLHRRGLATVDIDQFEINEAFAAQVLACQEAWSDRHYREEVLGDEPDQPIPDDALNPEGGAVAIGHPVGASGARLALHLALSMKRRGLTRGVASLCIGGGQGGALLLRAEGGVP
ncbi:acetyl-CoA C-acetyltransferase [Thiocapsa bogorovii]|uniref:acetyl-CoA C-acetyltransferase n=1 Tax=Thiocapsa bogorovii TaxID=521689 RepID=UPI001E6223B4|nr:acetyl-CoA C-acetyltransferase [Thiocapsa bogorovii]UHD17366.1 acetyl-CoA C-acetyltransferase [Thiocapsa bogorovii]